MKRISLTLLVLLTGCVLLSAPGDVQPITLTWDFNPVEDQVLQYRIYRVDAGPVYVQVAEVPGTTNVVTFTPDKPGVKLYVATAVNSFEESLPSNTVQTKGASDPKNNRLAP